MTHSAATLHALLAELRADAARTLSRGPTVLVAGPTDAGKSSLCRHLLWHSQLQAYDSDDGGASRQHPIVFADVDIGQGEIGLPGTIGASIVTRANFLVGSADVDRNNDADLAEFGANHNHPLRWLSNLHFYVGHTNMAEKSSLFKWYVKELASRIRNKHSADPMLAASGAVINTCGWVEGQGLALLMATIAIFQPSHVVVVGDVKLYDHLLHEQAAPHVLGLPRSHLAQRRSASYRRDARNARLRQYFTPPSSISPSPFLVNVAIADVRLFIVVVTPHKPTQVRRVAVVETLTRAVVAMCAAPTTADHALARATALGFLCIHSVNSTEKTIEFLSPRPGPLPSTHFILGQIEWIEG
ncbi:hypothetical protein H310_08684 [Aphanomyces invadans]|uniref:Uncharacterized protein n=1 Tax=Aphanomyces invadans TaxID=157072 RepID=A0A024TWM1_9STRA|nr:hypothetical protein H310_08684 [Aphanomyces invadans]ETV98560.1 hypothetical protein H310_08684 [Aphanomyces invadans]|eukprot:XP_008872757.1 hypothetical protein H310_08684 [Aphanomyces invadans]